MDWLKNPLHNNERAFYYESPDKAFGISIPICISLIRFDIFLDKEGIT